MQSHLKRAILEIISSGVACYEQDVKHFVNCTLLSAQKLLELSEKQHNSSQDSTNNEIYISECLEYLRKYEFIRLHTSEETNEQIYMATPLGKACLGELSFFLLTKFIF